MAQKLLTLAVVLLSVPAFGACGDSITQVVIRVDTELRVPCEVEEIEIVVDPAVVDDSGRAPGRIDLRNLLGSNALPLQLPIQGSSGQSYSVTVRAYNDGAIVQELSGTIDTKADSSRVLAFNLDSGEVATQADLPKRVLHAPSVCEEVCNGKDDNENGRIDENLPDCDPCSMCPEGYECVERVCRSARVARYVASRSGRQFTNACSAAQGVEVPGLLSSPLSGAAQISFPSDFSFTFYGRTVTSAWVGVDGWISFEASNPGLGGESLPITDSRVPGNSIFAFWDDLQLDGTRGRVCYVKSGTSFYITWSDLCFEPASPGSCDGGDSLFVTVELAAINEGPSDDRLWVVYGLPYEGSDVSGIHWSDSDPERAQGAMATIGVLDAVPSFNCSLEACDLSGRCPDQSPCGFTAIRNLTSLVDLDHSMSQDNQTAILFDPAE